jgi:hypothetical protein
MTTPHFEICPQFSGPCISTCYARTMPHLCVQPKYRDIIRSENKKRLRFPPTPSVPHGTSPIAVAEPFDQWAYVTTAQFASDTDRLIGALPRDIDLVIAVARSGLLPGGMIACRLHVPLLTISRSRGIVNPGHGIRMEGQETTPRRHVLLIDDTSATGREMRENSETIRQAYPKSRLTRAAVYAHPDMLSRRLLDICVRVYPGLHYLQWNWCNAGHGQHAAFDFDGILCEECPTEDDDDGPRYRAFLANARPVHLPRRLPARLIVTARHEKYRKPTEDWLVHHGVRWDRLVMRTWDYDPSRDRIDQIARWKADYYRRSDCTIFAESEPPQAEIINSVTGLPVLCPSLGRVLPPRSHTLPMKAVIKDRALASIAARMELVRECDRRIPESLPERRNCLEGKPFRCIDRKGRDGLVVLQDCLRCVEGIP